ncbi:hypothetical protein GCM10009665_50560 [Kitasatospora nipponensis]|uniref:Uncharacterized protein n=1 Tax=Kitasatospora nipponensis TaxID=258049 RepID=A0ABN1WKY8_9ACTN
MDGGLDAVQVQDAGQGQAAEAGPDDGDRVVGVHCHETNVTNMFVENKFGAYAFAGRRKHPRWTCFFLSGTGPD